MTQDLDLKPITKDAVSRSLEKAERYRLLNDPQQAESICLDILEVDPDHQGALRVLVLALTDQFASEHHENEIQGKARKFAGRLRDEYERDYYMGLICEREARAFLARHVPGGAAYESFMEALSLYERAERTRPPGNDDAILRWNSCVRTIREERLQSAPPDEGDPPLE